MALDKKTDVDPVSENDHDAQHFLDNLDDLTDSDFHEALPKEVLKIKDITIIKQNDHKKKNNDVFDEPKENAGLKVKLDKPDDRTEKKAFVEKQEIENYKKKLSEVQKEVEKTNKIKEKLQSQSSSQSKQSDSIGSIIPVITISTTESDDEILQHKKDTVEDKSKEGKKERNIVSRNSRNGSELKSLKRQSSVDSINEQNGSSKNKSDDGHKYQYSL